MVNHLVGLILAFDVVFSVTYLTFLFRSPSFSSLPMAGSDLGIAIQVPQEFFLCGGHEDDISNM
jgi:hypothetical protein